MTDTKVIEIGEKFICKVCGYSSLEKDYMTLHVQKRELTAPNGLILTYDRKSSEIFPFGFFPEQGFCILSENRESGFVYDVNHHSTHNLTAIERSSLHSATFRRLSSGKLLEYINHGHLRLLTPDEIRSFNERQAKFEDCKPRQFGLTAFLFNPDNLNDLLRRV